MARKQPQPAALPQDVTKDPTLCHYCNKNKLNPNEEYFLPNGIHS
ncbi:MAG TPA: hypothetical protein VFU48_15505 [Nitrospira sp.]|nr:hypothetical protein [Nitrospira sp.]